MPPESLLDSTYNDLRQEVAELRAKLEVSEETLRAIRSGEVDAITVDTPMGLRVFTLEGAEQPYRIMVESMSEGAVTVTTSGVILYCNRRFAEMANSDLDTIIGSCLLEFFGDEDRARVEAALGQSQVRVERLQAVLLASDGKQVPVNVTMHGVTNGEAHDVAAVVTDLSEILAAQAAMTELNRELQRQLAESQQKAILLDQAHDAIFVCDMEDRVQYWNHGAETTYDISAELALGHNRHQLLHTEFPEPLAQIEAELLRSGAWQGELGHTAGNGRKVTVASRWSLQRGPDGQPIAVLQINRDITAQKAVQTQLQAAVRYTRSLIEASLDPLVTISADGKITDVNKAAEAVTGRSREDLIGSDFSDYFTDPEKARAGYRRVFAEGTVNDYELAVRHTSGRVTDVLYNASIYHDADGNVAGVFAAARDVTERNRIEAELARHRQHLEELVIVRTEELAAANKELESFAYSVSHDLRAPLRAIDGFSQILLEDYTDRLDAEGKRLLQVVRDGATRMGLLIDHILGFSRISRQEPAMSDTDMGALVQETLRELAPVMAGRSIDVIIGPLPHVHGDPQMLRRVWTNLLDNAIKYTGSKPNALIEVGARPADGETVFFVKDNGVGFDMHYAEKLFGVFNRLHSADEFPGTGIGLAIVKRIVARHGGQVWAEGKVGEGATFHFTLPASESGHV